MIIAIGSTVPTVHESAFVAPTATLIGAVTIAAGSGIWYNCVLRADDASIAIGERTNIQDGTVIHADPGMPVHVGAGVSVGHNATLHGCTIGDNVLVGMGATVMNGAVIGDNSLIAAGALVPESFEVPAGSLIAGVPAKVRRQLSAAEVEGLAANARHYVSARVTHRDALDQAAK